MNSNERSGMNAGTGIEERGHDGPAGTAQSIKQRSREAGAAVKEKARETKERLVNQGSERVRQAKEQTRAFADERKSQLGERIHHYSSAVRRAADKLREEEDPNIAHYADLVAERIDQAADYVQARDAETMMRDVGNFARRRPEIFFGGMFFAGLLISRFMKASTQRDDSYATEENEEYWVEDSEMAEAELESGAEEASAGYTMASNSESNWEESAAREMNRERNT